MKILSVELILFFIKLLHEEQLKTDEAELASLRSQLREQTQTNETRVEI